MNARRFCVQAVALFLLTFIPLRYGWAFDELICDAQFRTFSGEGSGQIQDFERSTLMTGSFTSYRFDGVSHYFSTQWSGWGATKVKLEDASYRRGPVYLEVEVRNGGEIFVRFSSREWGFPDVERVLQGGFGSTGPMVIFGQDQNAQVDCHIF